MIEHINEAQTTKVLIVAPATADTLAKFAHGLADDFLSTMFLATTAPVIVAPAMNVNMWEHPATRANVETLKARACGWSSRGVGIWLAGWLGAGGWRRTAAIVAAVGEVLASEGAGRAGCGSGGRDGAGDCGWDAGGDRSGAVYREPVERADGVCDCRGGGAAWGAGDFD